MNKQNILIKTPQYEIEFEDLCNLEFKKINGLMNMIEKDFQVSLHDYPKLRGEILDISNFIKRLPHLSYKAIFL
jgi:hypothetical protein